ncbi:MAG: glycosyltransferase [Ginsengibacter sp.]
MDLIQHDIDYSLVICTYNPEERLLQRCLDAVANLDIDGITTEVILVDNNSRLPINSLQYVIRFIKKISLIKTIMVAAQGLKHARIGAIKEARGRHIVFFDSDNEPEKDYLQELKKLNEKFPEVAAIGPGDVSVDFVDGIDKNIEDYARIAFQERHEKAIRFSGLREWQSCYPFGTALCISSFLLKEYANLSRQGRFIMPGRTGNQLTSGDDTQMVLLCISRGYAAGVSPSLKIKHIIPEARANYKYLQRLAYGTGLCYETCLLQVFPEYKDELEKKIISRSKFSRRIIKKYVKVRWGSDPLAIFDLIQFISLNTGAYIALNKPLPALIKRIIKYLKLDQET